MRTSENPRAIIAIINLLYSVSHVQHIFQVKAFQIHLMSKCNLLSVSLKTRQLVTVCDSKLLTTAIQALSAARPEFIASRGSPSTHDTERVVLRSDQGSPQAKWSGKGNRASMNLNWQEEEWVRLFRDWHYTLMIWLLYLSEINPLTFRKRSGSMWIRVWSVWSAVWTGC